MPDDFTGRTGHAHGNHWDPNIGPQENKYLNLMIRGMKPITLLTPLQQSRYRDKIQPYLDSGELKLAYKDDIGIYISLPGEEWRGPKLSKLFHHHKEMTNTKPDWWTAGSKEFRVLHAKIGRLLGIPKESVRYFINKTR